MATKLNKRTVVICGGGLTAGLISRQLTAKGIDVARAGARRRSPRRGRGQTAEPARRVALGYAPGLDRRTGRCRPIRCATARGEEALPVRWMEAFLPGEGVGGAANHWNGQTWRWAEYDPMLRSRHETRYGKKAIPADMPIQDWGVTYAEMEPYHDLFEKLFGIAGKAGNIDGKIQPGGNPFEAPRQDEYPQQPLDTTEAGLIFKAAAEAIGYKPFPTPGGELVRRLHESRRPEARPVPVLRPLRALHLRSAGEGHVRKCCSIRCCCSARASRSRLQLPRARRRTTTRRQARHRRALSSIS